MQSRHVKKATTSGARWIATLALGLLPLAQAAPEDAVPTNFVPLPQDIFGEGPSSNPAIDLTTRITDFSADVFNLEIPDTVTINSEGGGISYDTEKRTITYSGGDGPVHLLTDNGYDVTAATIIAELDGNKAVLEGPLTVFQNETVTRAQKGTYNWETETLEVEGVRTKVRGLLIRGSSVSYAVDAKDRRYMTIRDAYVTTEDVQKPSTWVGAGELTVYPGDVDRLTRLRLAAAAYDVPVPIIGWISLTHSLNRKEGYMPDIGSRSIWGSYLLNNYGFLLGNRRVEGGIPVSDYILTTKADYRTRRGFATGIDFEDVEMLKSYKDMTGFSAYYLADSDPMINPTKTKRQHTRHNRYRISMRTRWDIDKLAGLKDDWALTTNINAVSDRYVLRDFFEEESRLDDKPDNTVTLNRRTDRSEAMLFTRLALNNYYTTDERAELSYYRTRTTIGNTPIAYETRNSFSTMRQEIPTLQRIEYRNALANLKDNETREYYERLLNSSGYMRFNTTHEFSTSFSVLRFLNVTPKGGVGYTGYYDVGGIGSDNRFLGYAGCDFDVRFNRRWENFSLSYLDLKGLTHVFHPYASISHGSISSSNELVPQVDTWSSTLGGSTINPMPLDLMGFTGIDGWGSWTIWRIGAQNVFTSTRDGSRVNLFSWNTFIDYNVDNPNTESRFSNLYSIFRFNPNERFSLNFETQTPTFRNGDGFSQYNTSITCQPTRWLEAQLGHRYLNSHPLHRDSSQVYMQTNLRVNERYTFAGRWYWDIEEKRFPIQQYSIFRNTGAWYVGATLFLRDNGGKKETGFGISFTLGETGTALPVNFF